MRILLVVSLALMAFAGPAQAKKSKKANKSSVIKVMASKKVAFTRFFFAIKPGSIIGRDCVGCPMEREFVWMDNIGPGLFDGLIIFGNKEMRDAGYDVTFPKNLLFQESSTHSARYQLGAWVSRLRVKTAYDIDDFGKRAALSLDEGKAVMHITWQLYDNFTEEVVFRHRTQATYLGKKPEVGLVLGAFIQSMRELLSSRKFVDAMKKENKPLPKKASIDSCTDRAPSLPGKLDDAMKSVVTLRSGSAHGTGFVISNSGQVLTAAHVVRGTDEVQVTFKDGKTEVAQVVATRPDNDAALLQLPGNTYSCTTLAKAKPKVGQDLFVIGAPASEKLSFSVARGIVSGEHVVDEKPFLQTDASINPGNSGGPMLNTRGEAVGVVSWKLAGVSMEGLGFGVPIDIAQQALTSTKPIKSASPSSTPAKAPITDDTDLAPDE